MMSTHPRIVRLKSALLHAAFVLPLALCSNAAKAELLVTSSGQVFTENFDALASTGTAIAWSNDSTLPGWSLFRQPAPGTALTDYEAGPGTNTRGSFYSFGSTDSSERALGGIGSGGAYWGGPAAGSVAGWFAVALTNNTGSSLNGFRVSFDGEQWRDGGSTTGVAAAQTMVFEYGFGPSFGAVALWVAPGAAFDFVSPIFSTSSTELDGNAAANRVAGIGGTVSTAWAADQTLWLRWIERNDASNDHGLAIDNFSFTANIPEPGTLALLGLGLAGLAAARRRKH